MSNRTFRLSVDELAYILAQSGRPDLGQGVLQSASDTELSAEDVLQRMLAAGHSLIARNLLSINEDATPVLTEDIRWLVQVLVSAPFSIRYTMATAEAQFQLTYHSLDGGVVEHAVELGIVHVITEYTQPDAAIDGGVEFFQITNLQSSVDSQGEVAKELLDQALSGMDIKTIQKILSKGTLASQVRDHLAEDIAQTVYRGTVLRIEYGPNGEPIADRGFLLLRGEKRFWILKPLQRPNGAFVTIIPGSESLFRREVAALMSS